MKWVPEDNPVGIEDPIMMMMMMMIVLQVGHTQSMHVSLFTDVCVNFSYKTLLFQLIPDYNYLYIYIHIYIITAINKFSSSWYTRNQQ